MDHSGMRQTIRTVHGVSRRQNATDLSCDVQNNKHSEVIMMHKINKLKKVISIH